MKSKKLIIAVVVIAVVAIWWWRKNKVSEPFWMIPARSIKVMPEVQANGKSTSLLNQSAIGPADTAGAGVQFISTPNFQSLLAPRMNGNGYGAFINYSAPDYKNLAVPADPLGYGKLVNEGYTNIKCSSCAGDCSGNICNNGGTDPSQMAGVGVNNIRQGMTYEAQLASQGITLPETTDLLPVGGMTASAGSGQPVVFDRYIYSQKRSRLLENSDMIRGDLAINPEPTGWFRPSVNVITDLRQGAMNVMGGVNNQSSKDLAKMVNTAAAGALTTFGGTSFPISLQNIGQDVTVSSFP